MKLKLPLCLVAVILFNSPGRALSSMVVKIGKGSVNDIVICAKHRDRSAQNIVTISLTDPFPDFHGLLMLKPYIGENNKICQ